MPQNTQANKIDLAKLFGAVAGNLGNQREALNQADTYNNDHGDHMVEIFEVVTQAVKEKKNASPADQLAYASEILRQKQSGSAQAYANGFAHAAQQFQGQAVTTDRRVAICRRSHDLLTGDHFGFVLAHAKKLRAIAEASRKRVALAAICSARY